MPQTARPVSAARLTRIGIASIALVALALASPARAQQPTAETFRATTQKLADALNAGNEQAVLDLLSPLMRKGFVDLKATDAFPRLVQEHGKLTQVGTPVASGTTARVPVTTERGSLTLTVTLDNDNLISGLTATPVPPEPPVPARNTAPMRLPVTGDWYVYWAGATEAENFHVRSKPQQRAFDLLMTDQMGQTHKGFGTSNSDYYAYGQTVSAPADGTVAQVVTGVPENTPGIANPYNALGNLIVIKVSDNTYAVLGHLQPGSVTVKAGDTVKAGQAIGKVGNTGNIEQPYLHFHLQNGPNMQEATGFEPHFTGVKLMRGAETTTPADYVPARGDRISPAP